MFDIRPFEPDHVRPLLDQPMNSHWKPDFENRNFEILSKQESFSVFYQGRVQACGGITQIWPGRGLIWTVFNEESRVNFLPTFRAIKQFLQMSMVHYSRLEVAIPIGLHIGHKRAKALGFLLECACARKYTPKGEDCSIYVMIR